MFGKKPDISRAVAGPPRRKDFPAATEPTWQAAGLTAMQLAA